MPTHGFGGPVLVTQGVNDRVTGPALSRSRADTLARLRETITVDYIEGGHCVHDDSPEKVARSIFEWMKA